MHEIVYTEHFNDPSGVLSTEEITEQTTASNTYINVQRTYSQPVMAGVSCSNANDIAGGGHEYFILITGRNKDGIYT